MRYKEKGKIWDKKNEVHMFRVNAGVKRNSEWGAAAAAVLQGQRACFSTAAHPRLCQHSFADLINIPTLRRRETAAVKQPPPSPPPLDRGRGRISSPSPHQSVPASFISHSSSFHSQRRDAPLILLFVIQASIMHKLVNLAVQRGMTWNPVERAVWSYISDGDNGKLNACLSDCPVSHAHSSWPIFTISLLNI